MTSYVTPARVRWPRTNNTGQEPETLAPGSMAVNWADKKIFVGGAGAQPMLFSQWIDDWDTAKLYRQGDFVIQQSDIWRAKQVIQPGRSFDGGEWTRLTASGSAAAANPYSSDIFEGGDVSIVSATGVSVARGQGAVIDNTDPVSVVVTIVSWSGFSSILTAPSAGSWSVLAIGQDNVLQQVDLSAWNEELRRDHIVLAYVLWDLGSGTIEAVVDGSRRAAGTAETYIDEYEVNGGPYRASGGRPAAVTGTLNLSLSAASIFAMGSRWRTNPKRPNLITTTKSDPLEFTYADRRSTIPPLTELVDPDSYDSGTAVVPVPAGQWTIQYLTGLNDFSSFSLQYGQALYDTQQEAVNNLVDDWNAFVALQGSTLASIVVGAVVVQQGAVDLDNARVINAGRGNEPFNSFSRETDTDDFYVLDGSRPLTGDMDADGNDITNAIMDGGVYA